jgi:gamma-glutamyltranspeptidase
MPEVLEFETQWVNQAVPGAMQSKGHTTGKTAGVGTSNLIGITSEGVHASSDPRRGGRPAGY